MDEFLNIFLEKLKEKLYNVNTLKILGVNMDRLDTICQLVKSDSIVYDIGCDHGYLLAKLYNKICKGYALDIAEKPLISAKNTIKKAKIGDKISAILSDGMEKVDEENCDVIVIAGMGGQLIKQIISQRKTPHPTYSFILQAMSKPEILRKYLWENGFEIETEVISKEERRFYTIIKAKYTGNVKKSELFECYYSECLKKDKYFKPYVNEQIEKLEKIMAEIADETNENYIFHKKVLSKLKESKNG